MKNKIIANGPGSAAQNDKEQRERRPRNRQSGLAVSDGRIFRPGAPITDSGIYEVLHERDHRTAHEAVMIAGDRFPECDTCRDRVRFRLVRTAPYIFQDADFEESE